MAEKITAESIVTNGVVFLVRHLIGIRRNAGLPVTDAWLTYAAAEAERQIIARFEATPECSRIMTCLRAERETRARNEG